LAAGLSLPQMGIETSGVLDQLIAGYLALDGIEGLDVKLKTELPKAILSFIESPRIKTI